MAGQKSPSFPFYYKDWRSSRRVQRMSWKERGLYLELMIEQWDSGPLPDDLPELADRIGATVADLKKAWLSIGKCFDKQPDGTLLNEPLERHRRVMLERRQRMSDDGKHGASKRWPGHSHPIATPLRDVKPPHTTPDSFAFATANAIANASAIANAEDALTMRAGDLIRRYQALYAKKRHGALLKVRPHLDYQRACDICRTWQDDARLDKMAEIMLTTDDEWIAGTDRGFGVFAAKATWCDERLSAWEAKNRASA